MRESIALGPRGSARGSGRLGAGGGVGKRVSAKGFIDLVASALTQANRESWSGEQAQEGSPGQKQ